MMRWFIIAAAILVVAGIFSIIKSLINNRKERTESQTATPQPEQKIKFKAGYGKMWNWIIPIGIISALVLGFWIAPKYYKMNVISKPAAVIWKKKPDQYGREPEKRTSGYLNATLTEDSDTKFCFAVHVGRNEDSHYNGRKVGGDRIEGSWRNPPDGGKWYLKRDMKNSKLYKGGIDDPYLSDWAYFELEILD